MLSIVVNTVSRLLVDMRRTGKASRIQVLCRLYLLFTAVNHLLLRFHGYSMQGEPLGSLLWTVASRV